MSWVIVILGKTLVCENKPVVKQEPQGFGCWTLIIEIYDGEKQVAEFSTRYDEGVYYSIYQGSEQKTINQEDVR